MYSSQEQDEEAAADDWLGRQAESERLESRPGMVG